MKFLGNWISVPLLGVLIWCLLLWKGYGWFRSASHKETLLPESITPCQPAAERRTKPHNQALQQMPLNWKIRQEDTNGPLGLRGLYVACAVVAGDPITQADVLDLPKITASTGKILYRYQISPNPGINMGLNAEMHAQIFDHEGTPIVSDARIAAVVSDKASSAILEMTAPEARLLSSASDARLVPRL